MNGGESKNFEATVEGESGSTAQHPEPTITKRQAVKTFDNHLCASGTRKDRKEGAGEKKRR